MIRIALIIPSAHAKLPWLWRKLVGLDAERTRALGMAAQLANPGKLNLPRELLTKMQPLSSEEQMHSSVLDTINILKGLEFDGPVVDIINQKNESLDGSGYPEGIKGDAILTESRILSVANAFVAMSSARISSGKTSERSAGRFTGAG